MKKWITAVVLAISLAPMGQLTFAEETKVEQEAERDVPAFLQEISVTIRARFSEGSGVAITRGDTTYVWTAAHVVDALRKTRSVVDPSTGTTRMVVEFDDAKIIKTLVENGRTVGRIEMDAEVIRYSDMDHGEDLALLRVRKKNFIHSSAEFYLGGPIPQLGTDLFHVGSLLGQQGANSMTTGIVSQHGRLINKKVFDQTTVTAFPGSSGGGVYLCDGRYIGMLVRGAGEGFNLVVPIRRMYLWAKSAGVEWAIDPKVDVPSDEELAKLPIEDVGARFSGSSKNDRKSLLIRMIDEPDLLLKLP